MMLFFTLPTTSFTSHKTVGDSISKSLICTPNNLHETIPHEIAAMISILLIAGRASTADLKAHPHNPTPCICLECDSVVTFNICLHTSFDLLELYRALIMLCSSQFQECPVAFIPVDQQDCLSSSSSKFQTWMWGDMKCGRVSKCQSQQRVRPGGVKHQTLSFRLRPLGCRKKKRT